MSQRVFFRCLRQWKIMSLTMACVMVVSCQSSLPTTTGTDTTTQATASQTSGAASTDSKKSGVVREKIRKKVQAEVQKNVQDNLAATLKTAVSYCKGLKEQDNAACQTTCPFHLIAYKKSVSCLESCISTRMKNCIADQLKKSR